MKGFRLKIGFKESGKRTIRRDTDIFGKNGHKTEQLKMAQMRQ
jgi:hypothetical protein